MKRLLFLLLFLSSPLLAETTKTVFNPFTGKSDYITSLETINGVCYQWPSSLPSSDSLCLGESVVNSCVVLAWTSCSGGPVTPASANYALLEQTDFLLSEDGTKLQLEK